MKKPVNKATVGFEPHSNLLPVVIASEARQSGSGAWSAETGLFQQSHRHVSARSSLRLYQCPFSWANACLGLGNDECRGAPRGLPSGGYKTLPYETSTPVPALLPFPVYRLLSTFFGRSKPRPYVLQSLCRVTCRYPYRTGQLRNAGFGRFSSVFEATQIRRRPCSRTARLRP